MYVVTPETGVNWSGKFYRANSQYLLYSREAQSMREAGAPIRIGQVSIPAKLDRDRVTSLCVIVAGGLGDRIQATPALRELAKRVDGGQIDVYSLGPLPEWEHLPYIGHVSVGAAPLWILDAYDAVLTWEGIIDVPEAQQLPLHQLFAWWMGVELSDERPDFVLQDWEAERLNPLRDFPTDKPALALHIGCHGPARAWPPLNWLEVASRLRDHFHVLLLGAGQEGPVWETTVGNQRYILPPPEWITDLCGALPDIRHTAAVLKSCALFAGADSGPLHLAGTLGVPSVGLYGPFGYRLRGTNLSVAPLEVLPPDDKCPCHTHAQSGDKLPCEREHCVMMTAITPERVAEKLLEVHEHGWEAARDASAGGAGADSGGGDAAGSRIEAGGADAAGP